MDSPETAPSRARWWLPILLLVLPAFALRGAAANHGFPRGYVPDTHMVRSALGMAQSRNPVPAVGTYSTYPYLVPYMLLPVYGAQFAWGKVDGRWGGAEEFATRAKLDPSLVQRPARFLVAFLGALAPWLVFLAARAAGAGIGAWVAGYLVLTGLLHLQFSVQERPWIPTVTFGAAVMFPLVRHVLGGRRRDLLLAGAAAGLSLACHQAGAVYLGLCGLGWLFAWQRFTGSEIARRVVDGVLCVATFGVVALLLGHAYYLVHGSVETAAVVGGDEAAGNFSIGGQSIRMGVDLGSLVHLSKALVGYDPVLLVLGLIGLPLALARRGTRAIAVFLLGYAAFFMTNPNDHVRYLLPMTPLLALCGAFAVDLVARNRVLGRVVLAGLLVVPTAQALRLVHLLRTPDSRAEGEMLLAELPEDAVVAIDHYGPVVDLSLGALERLSGWRELRTREGTRFELLRGGHLGSEAPGVDAVYVEELFGFDESTETYGVRPEFLERGSTPGEVLDSIGVSHLLLVDRRPGDSELPHLAELLGDTAPLWILDPSVDPGEPSDEALLPTDMDFPLTGLWDVRRPGPWMALYPLR